MNFTSFLFLFLFLPITLIVYSLCNLSKYSQDLKNLSLLILSLLFYGWGTPIGLPILLITSLADHLIAKKLIGHHAKYFLTLGLTINLLCLFYFKYSNFFVAQSNILLLNFGFSSIPWANVLLPAGISFFTFEKMSYLIDVYRKEVQPCKSIKSYLLFVSLFPHLIAGPILKYKDLIEQIQNRTEKDESIIYGFRRFIFGLSKKVLIADVCAKSANIIFDGTYAAIPSYFVILGIIAYSFQIYFDFSGYSDMAIGLAKIFGFNFIENFKNPYLASSITDFWKKWHISLTNWMREYLYIPLGGNKLGLTRTYLNLCFVFFVSGLWHGAQWTFIVWGLFHGVLLLIERVQLFKFKLFLIPKFCKQILTFALVSFGWTIFRAQTLVDVGKIIVSVLNWSPLEMGPIEPHNSTSLALIYPEMIIQPRGAVIMILAAVLIILGDYKKTYRLSDSLAKPQKNLLLEFIVTGYTLVLILLCSSSLAEGNYSPFLYFQF